MQVASAGFIIPPFFLLLFIQNTPCLKLQKQAVSIDQGAQRVRGVNTLMLWRTPFDQSERRLVL